MFPIAVPSKLVDSFACGFHLPFIVRGGGVCGSVRIFQAHSFYAQFVFKYVMHFCLW